ncbi:LON peptidase substrate-binding domain-containing protein [Tropicimonas sp. IMCC34043]|uniref:LON peptidase substrate-binding domain-containing protein n=1 Tax=Tropicimonas sp. IMCC34043 TaxID=2248760 RepID=UPI000E225317|nr:LON peptidase substrate-binding domain-containing protein [Tropicimonas sp. IMCC34043]
MFAASDLPDVIPMFPLPGALLLPRARLPLQIFEPRYLAMLDDVLKTQHRLIGMVQPRLAATAGQSELQAIGCAGRVTGFSETGDGRYMITLTGISRFRILREVSGFAPYRKADVGWDSFASDLGATEHDPGLDRAAFLKLLARYFDALSLTTDWSTLKDAQDELLINSLAMLCPFEVEDKQALLEAPTLADRRESLTALIRFALHAGDDGNEVMQ